MAEAPGTDEFIAFVRLVVDGSTSEVARLLEDAPGLATMAMPSRAERQAANDLFFAGIAHYMYERDTALHMAAAAGSLPAAELLVARGAVVRAKNRRGAEPLHYAADANHPGQGDVVRFLLGAGADPDAGDASGVAALHRAVRKRATSAVIALLEGGANVRQPNGSGSPPLHLAVQNTGAGGSGSAEARRQQETIIRLLLAHGASPGDADAKGKTVLEAATGARVRQLLTGLAG